MRHTSIRNGIALAVVCVAFTGARAAAEDVVVSRITVVGSLSRTPEQLVSTLVTRVGEPYDPVSLDTDIKRLWKLGIYEDIAWGEPVVEEGGVALTLTLVERAHLASIEYRGYDHVDMDTLKGAVRDAGLTVDASARFDRALAFRAAEAIREEYRKEKYFLAEVSYYTEAYEGPGIDGIPSVKLVFDVTEGRPAPIRGIRFVGNKAFSDRQLWKFVKAITDAQGDGGVRSYDRLRFERAVGELRRLYRNAGYLDARAELTELELYTWTPPGSKKEMWISPVIEIDEGELYRVGRITIEVDTSQIEGPLEISSDDMMKIITAPAEEYAEQDPFKTGVAFSEQTEAQAANRVEKVLGHYGRIKSEVSSRHRIPATGTQIDVVFSVRPSPPYVLGGVSVRGNHKTKRDVFLRELEQAGLAPGRLIDSRKLDLAIKNIRYTGLVKDERNESTGELLRAAVQVKPFPREKNIADLYVDVNEGETGSLMLGASVNSNGELAGSIEFSQRNFDLLGLPRSASDWTNAFTGAGQSLSLSATFGTVSDVFKMDFEEPYFLGLPLRFHLNVTDIVTRREDYTEARVGATVSLGHSWSLHRYKRRRLGAYFKWRDEMVGITSVGTTPIPDVNDFVASFGGDARVRRVGGTISYESRDSRLLPSQGSYLAYSYEFAGGEVGGELDFITGGLEYQHHMRLKRDKNDQPYVLQFKIKGNWVRPYGNSTEVPFFERYYAGGFGTLRGFDYRSIGPTVLVSDPDMIPDSGDERFEPSGGDARFLSTLEYTFPLSPDSSLRCGIYYDTGFVWDDLDDVDFSDLKQSAGIGLLIQPAGFPVPISLYLGWIINKQPEDDDQVVSFMIGTMFY